MLSFHAAGKAGIEVGMDAKTIPSEVNWIDAVRPDAREIAFLERTLGIAVPTLENAFRNRNVEPAAQREGLALSQYSHDRPGGWFHARADTARLRLVEGRAPDGAFQAYESL